jgi:hypothetical protein
MQTTKRPTGLGTAAPDYETLVQQAINKVTGFELLYKELERAIMLVVRVKVRLPTTPVILLTLHFIMRCCQRSWTTNSHRG